MQRLGPKIQEEKQNDMKTLFEMKQEFKIETEKWPFIPQETRKYEVIEEYAPNPPEEQYCEIIWKKLKTEKQYQFHPIQDQSSVLHNVSVLSLRSLGALASRNKHGTLSV
jgi:hypothetical protein